MHSVICDGGLANRLNTLICALVLKSCTKTAWKISWPTNNWCGADFSSLFETDLPIDDNSLSYYKKHQSRYKLIFHENQIGFDDNRIIYINQVDTLEKLLIIVSRYPRILYYNNSIPSFITDEQFHNAWSKIGIKREILDLVGEFTANLKINSEIFGVHIRKTDFGNSVDDEKIYHDIANSDGRFFICTDSDEVQKRFANLKNCVFVPKSRFPEKYAVEGSWNDLIKDSEGRIYPFNVNRDSESVFWGLIDLLILSKTKIILTSGSSFLGFAARLSRVNSKCSK